MSPKLKIILVKSASASVASTKKPTTSVANSKAHLMAQVQPSGTVINKCRPAFTDVGERLTKTKASTPINKKN